MSDVMTDEIEIEIRRSKVNPALWEVQALFKGNYQVFACASLESLDEAMGIVQLSVLSVTGQNVHTLGALGRHK